MRGRKRHHKRPPMARKWLQIENEKWARFWRSLRHPPRLPGDGFPLDLKPEPTPPKEGNA